MGAASQYLLSKPLEEVQIEMTNDSSFLSSARFRSGTKKMGKKWEPFSPENDKTRNRYHPAEGSRHHLI